VSVWSTTCLLDLVANQTRYLNVIRKLILTYTLEPAGSHGVWGLDDHAFIPYIFGSAQFTRPISGTEPMPLEGSVRGAPKPKDITSPEKVNDYRSNDVKNGPFWEHSPMLFDISGIRDGWGKINKGMIKMFDAEVLSKFPVVQHFPFGSLFSWDENPEASAPVQSVHMANQPASMGPPTGAVTGTAAPWAQTRHMPTVSGDAGHSNTRAAWPLGTSNSPREQQLAGIKPESGSAQEHMTGTKAPWSR
jgi:serine/threonine-protein phosphatase 2A activator